MLCLNNLCAVFLSCKQGDLLLTLTVCWLFRGV